MKSLLDMWAMIVRPWQKVNKEIVQKTEQSVLKKTAVNHTAVVPELSKKANLNETVNEQPVSEKSTSKMASTKHKPLHEETASEQIAEIEEKIADESKRIRSLLRRRYRMLYALVAFFGVSLLWYGMWTIISEWPIISNPYIASALGILILLVLGVFFENTI